MGTAMTVDTVSAPGAWARELALRPDVIVLDNKFWSDWARQMSASDD